MWRDIQIVFTRNLPSDVSETINEVNSLRCLVSDKTLLAQIPFITDVDAELEAVQKQKMSNMELYNFGTSEVEDDGDEE